MSTPTVAPATDARFTTSVPAPPDAATVNGHLARSRPKTRLARLLARDMAGKVFQNSAGKFTYIFACYVISDDANNPQFIAATLVDSTLHVSLCKIPVDKALGFVSAVYKVSDPRVATHDPPQPT